MSRLAAELQRLYFAVPPDPTAADPWPAQLVDAQGRVRAMVLEVARPAEWEPLARVWQAVQQALALPAPAIAVNGHDGCQLWFSLAEPRPAAQARVFLEALRARHLAELPSQRVGLWPKLDGEQVQHARPVPARRDGDGPWSAFVAPDLAPMFSDEPWLDLPPSPEGQAQLLASLAPIAGADFDAALAALRPAATAAVPADASPVAVTASTLAAPAGGWTDPRRFLLDVVNDAGAPLALRIEAAKALLASPR